MKKVIIQFNASGHLELGRSWYLYVEEDKINDLDYLLSRIDDPTIDTSNIYIKILDEKYLNIILDFLYEQYDLVSENMYNEEKELYIVDSNYLNLPGLFEIKIINKKDSKKINDYYIISELESKKLLIQRYQDEINRLID